MQTVKIMEEIFESESTEIALYLAMSRKAEEEGMEEISRYFRKVAMDEALHASEFAFLLGKIKDTRSNLEMMLTREENTEKEKIEAAEIALLEGHDDAYQIFIRTLRDENGHKKGIKKVLSNLHEKD